MRTGTFLEYLGEISSDLILQNLTNESQSKPSIEEFRLAFPRGFVVSVQIQQQIHETPEEKRKAPLNSFKAGCKGQWDWSRPAGHLLALF